MDYLDDKRLSESIRAKREEKLKAVAIKRPPEKSHNQIILSEANKPLKLIKKPRVVVNEDEYLDDLQKIIVRDYFPELPKLKVSSNLSFPLLFYV